MDSLPPPERGSAEQAPPQFSPDGRFWWDGTQWTPVDQLQRPEQFQSSGTHHDAWHDERDSTRSLSRVGVLLIGVGAIVLVVWAVFQFGIVKFH